MFKSWHRCLRRLVIRMKNLPIIIQWRRNKGKVLTAYLEKIRKERKETIHARLKNWNRVDPVLFQRSSARSNHLPQNKRKHTIADLHLGAHQDLQIRVVQNVPQERTKSLHFIMSECLMNKKYRNLLRIRLKNKRKNQMIASLATRVWKKSSNSPSKPRSLKNKR